MTFLISTAYAHGFEEHAGTEPFGWSFEPWVVIPILLVAMLYAAGSVELAKRGTADRRLAMALFWSGLVVLALALMSPLHEYGEQLFSAHMVEHELLMVVAVPLMVMARPGPVLLWGMPNTLRAAVIKLIRHQSLQRIWSGTTELWSATALHAVVLWAWHLPVLFQAAVEDEGMHILQHLSFIVSAMFFWTAVLDRSQRRFGQGMAALALFFTSLEAGLLGALITFSSHLWYPNCADPFPVAGLTRLEDQTLAGLIMWVPACTIYVIAALAILARWFLQLEVRHESEIAS